VARAAAGLASTVLIDAGRLPGASAGLLEVCERIVVVVAMDPLASSPRELGAAEDRAVETDAGAVGVVEDRAVTYGTMAGAPSLRIACSLFHVPVAVMISILCETAVPAADVNFSCLPLAVPCSRPLRGHLLGRYFGVA
jgi:hypothetical protein